MVVSAGVGPEREPELEPAWLIERDAPFDGRLGRHVN
jgi:hypothetical protein